MGQEAEIERKVCKYARSKGCYVRKFKSPGNRGVPDKLLLTPRGEVFFMEFKAPGNAPTDLQAREIREINNRRGSAHWTDSVEDGKAIVDGHL